MRWKVITLFLLALVNLSCLNVFSPIDSPSGDAQFLSLARACFDQGDIDCANKYYAKVSGTTEAETAAAEEAFTILDKNGATMGALMQSLGCGASSSRARAAHGAGSSALRSSAARPGTRPRAAPCSWRDAHGSTPAPAPR